MNRFRIVAIICGLTMGAVEAQTKPPPLEYIGGDFFVDMSSLKPSATEVSAEVLEKDTQSSKTKASFRATFSCGSKGTAQAPDPSTPMGRFAAVHAENPDMYANKKICQAAHVEGEETRVARATAAALADAKQALTSSKWILVAGNPSMFVSITDTNKVAIFIDRDSISGNTARFAIYPLEQLRAAMHTDPRAWLIEPVTSLKPGYPKGPDLSTLTVTVATQAAQRTEPSARYVATYDCDKETVRVSVGEKEETGLLGYSGADPRNIGIAARYFCPNYSVTGVTFYKFDK
jgi:hypothetical protein